MPQRATAINVEAASYSRFAELPPEERLLLDWAAATLQDVIADDSPTVSSAIDWLRLRSLAVYHGLLPLISRAVLSLPGDVVPHESRDLFRRDAAISSLRAQANCLELIRVVEALEGEGIAAISFKGPALSKQAYGDYLVRKPGDIDLLVPRHDLDRANKVLSSCGYSPRTETLKQGKKTRRRGSVVLARERFSIDLHWTLQQESFDSLPEAWPFDTEEVVNRSVKLDLAGHTIQTLSPEDHFEFLCLHGAKDNWSRLVMILDLAALLAAVPDFDWERILKRRGRFRHTRVVDVGVLMAQLVFCSAIPAELAVPVKTDSVSLSIATEFLNRLFATHVPSSSWSFHLGRAKLYRGWHRQAGYICRRARRKISKLSWSD